MNTQLICSYVNNQYFVSTIYRQCSAMGAGDIWYYETMVWEWNAGRGKMVSQHDSGSSVKYAVQSHMTICAELAVKSNWDEQSIREEHARAERRMMGLNDPA